MTDYRFKAMELTEDIGCGIADLDEAIESIHYDPEKATAEDIKALKEVARLLEKATKIAEKTAERLK